MTRVDLDCAVSGAPPGGRLSTISPIDLLLAWSGWIALALIYLPPGNPVRVAGAFLFILCCPGMAISRFVSHDPLERAVLAVALSVALGIIVTTAMAIVRNDSTALRISILATITTLTVLCGVRLAARRPSSIEPPSIEERAVRR